GTIPRHKGAVFTSCFASHRVAASLPRRDRHAWARGQFIWRLMCEWRGWFCAAIVFSYSALFSFQRTIDGFAPNDMRTSVHICAVPVYHARVHDAEFLSLNGRADGVSRHLIRKITF